MKNIVVEVLDERDKDSAEPWSFFGAYETLESFHNEWAVFVQYCRDYPIVEMRIKQIGK